MNRTDTAFHKNRETAIFVTSSVSVYQLQQFFIIAFRNDQQTYPQQNLPLHLNSVAALPDRNCAVNINITYIFVQ